MAGRYPSENMGAGFVAVLWLAIFVMLFAIWSMAAAISFYAWKRRSYTTAGCFAIPATVIGLAGMLFVCLMIYAFIASFNPMTAYTSFIDETPGPEVSNVKSSVYWFADTGSAYIAFTIDEKELRELIPHSMKECDWTELRNNTMESGSEPPSWWRIDYNNRWIYFLRNDRRIEEPGKRGFYSETEYFAYDRDESRAYFRFIGID